MLRWLLNRGYALLIIGAIALHAYIAVKAYQIADPGLGEYAAALSALWFPVIAQIVVAYYVWQETGSRVNEYSIWILLWLFFAAVVALVARIERRLKSR